MNKQVLENIESLNHQAFMLSKTNRKKAIDKLFEAQRESLNFITERWR